MSITFRKSITSRLLVIGGMLIGQASLLPLSAQAQSYSENPSGNCGFSRPFARGDLNWSGWSPVTNGYSEAILDKLSSTGTFQRASYQKNTGTGESATVVADAGLSGSRGTFRGTVNFKTSFYTTLHTYTIARFSC